MFTREKGVFIALEGGEGSGKSTLARYLQERLSLLTQREVTLTREPGSTHLSEGVRRILLSSKRGTICSEAETLLFLSARAQSVEEVIEPALNRGEVVICDRFHASTLAYQGGGRLLSTASLQSLCDFSSKGLWPHLTLFLDIEPAEGLRRSRGGGFKEDRIDGESLAFHERVRKMYLQLTLDNPGTYARVNAHMPLESVLESSWELVQGLLLLHPLMGKQLESQRPLKRGNTLGEQVIP